MIRIEEYLEVDGTSPFGRWFAELDGQAAAFITVYLARLADGNTSNLKAINEGVSELKIDRGPGYRVYLG